MDSRRLDELVRSLTALGTRRAAIGASLTGALAALAFAWSDSAAKKRKRKRKKKKKCRGCPVCKECVKGKCRALPDFTACGGVCQECQGGSCANKANDTACDEDGKCLDGGCNPRPDCIDGNVSGCEAMPDCCSGVCNVPPMEGICQLGEAGTECKTDSGCASGSCIGYRCAE